MTADRDHILHFSLGPVQGFIAEARRTRDLWAGSFLLSWLVGKAIFAAKEAVPGLHITYPRIEGDRIYEALTEAAAGRAPDAPYLGSLGNHVRAEVPASFEPEIMTKAVQDAWVALAERVWSNFLEPVLKDNPDQHRRTRSIWEQQIGSATNVVPKALPPFWECVWVKGPAAADDVEWLDRRKSWRAFPDRTADGDMCMMMTGWQELSGRTRATREREQQRGFWKTLREQVGYVRYRQRQADTLDLREGERLCAIALVKRLFPLLPAQDLKDTIGWVPGDWKDAQADRREIKYWPSTAALSALRWVQRAERLASNEAQDYAQLVGEIDHLNAMAERRTITEVSPLSLPDAERPEGPRLAHLDGTFFFESALKRDDLFSGSALGKLPPGAEERKQALDRWRDQLRSRLKALTKVEGADGAVRSPAGYYAVLAMDGDRVGQLLRKDVHSTTQKIANFSSAAEKTVKKHHGFVVYAGGDDLLALLPLEDALGCACDIEAEWSNIFKGETTISGAVIFAHYRVVLRWVLAEARALLDGLAKEANGRASLAVRVMRQGAEPIAWVSAWSVGDKSPPRILDALVHEEGEGNQRFIGTNRFVYRFAERLSFLFHDPEKPIADRLRAMRYQGTSAAIEDEAELTDLVEAVAASAEIRPSCDVISRLLFVSRLHPSDATVGVATRPLIPEAAFLIRHLVDCWRALPPTSVAPAAETGAAA